MTSAIPFNGSLHPLQQPLHEVDFIRLAKLPPGENDDPIEIELFVVRLEDASEFDGISYVWGDASARATIKCNGIEMLITERLEQALRRARLKDQSRTVWADGVCINQDDLRERSHQVSFMGKIYQSARQVLICINEDDVVSDSDSDSDESVTSSSATSGAGVTTNGSTSGSDDSSDCGDCASNVAGLVAESAERISAWRAQTGLKDFESMPTLSPEDPLYDDQRWVCISHFLSARWFSRTWVVQEAGLAKDARVLYGNQDISYTDVLVMMLWIESCAPNLDSRKGVELTALWPHRAWLNQSADDWEPVHHYGFLGLLSYSRYLDCSDPRDHIYAFLGHRQAILEDGSGTIIIPDYTKSAEEVSTELAMQLLHINGTNSLMLVRQTEKSIEQDLLSWIPRWHDDTYDHGSLGVTFGDSYQASPEISGNSHYEVTPENFLRVSGSIIDVIEYAFPFDNNELNEECPNYHEHERKSSKKAWTLDRIWSHVEGIQAPAPYEIDNIATVFSLTLCAGYFWRHCRHHGDESPQEKCGLEPHKASFSAFWKLRQDAAKGLGKGEARPGAELQKAEEFWTDLCSQSVGQSFITTKKGFLGLGPLVSKPGDVCCLVHGANVAFILRPVPDRGQSYYKLVGEAYVQGLMGGDTVDDSTECLLNKDFLQDWKESEEIESFILC